MGRWCLCTFGAGSLKSSEARAALIRVLIFCFSASMPTKASLTGSDWSSDIVIRMRKEFAIIFAKDWNICSRCLTRSLLVWIMNLVAPLIDIGVVWG